MYRKFSCFICFAVLCFSASANTADFVVQSGDTVNVTQVLSDDGDQGLIEDGGAIETVGANGVNMQNSNQVVLNEGVISTDGDGTNGIFSTGSNSEITNSGSISTEGINSTGVRSSGSDNEITNSGSISAEGSGAKGIWSTGSDAKITNSGSVSILGGMMTTRGIYVQNVDNAVILNSGSISMIGMGGVGVESNGVDVKITNSGSISTQGNSGQGILNNGDRAFILSSGSISTEGGGAHGVRSTGVDVKITNSGSILIQLGNSHGIFNQGANTEVINSGSISTLGFNARGIQNTAIDVKVKNGGSISTVGGGAHGIFNQGANAELMNSGSILTQGAGSHGIYNLGGGANAVISNSGTISTQAGASRGIFNEADNVEITNSGSILTDGNSARGIVSNGADTKIINKGSISTNGFDTFAIESTGENALIANSGSISTTGDSANVIDSRGDDAVIINSGEITATGDGAHGIFLFESDDSHIINSGTIISTNGHAINVVNSLNPTLTLNQGSNIQGSVRSESALDLNVGRGLNLLLTLTDDSDGFDQLNISSPYILLNSNSIFVMDGTLFAIHEDMAHDMSDSILGGVRHNCCPSPCGCGLWTQTIGSYRKRLETGDSLPYSDWQLGQMIGYDRVSNGVTVGVFGGYLHGEGKTSDPIDKICQNTYFGGLSLAKTACDACFGLTFSVGYVDWDETLYIMDNLAPGGIDLYANGNSGTFITSEFSLMKQFCTTSFSPCVTFSVRHAGLYLGSSTVEGTDLSVVIKRRDIDLLSTRLDVGIPLSVDGFCFEPFTGIYGRYKLKGSHIELEGSDTTFPVGLNNKLMAWVIGVRGDQCFCKKQVTFSVSGDFDNEKSSRVLGSLGIYF